MAQIKLSEYQINFIRLLLGIGIDVVIPTTKRKSKKPYVLDLYNNEHHHKIHFTDKQLVDRSKYWRHPHTVVERNLKNFLSNGKYGNEWIPYLNSIQSYYIRYKHNE